MIFVEKLWHFPGILSVSYRKPSVIITNFNNKHLEHLTHFFYVVEALFFKEVSSVKD